MDWKIAVEFDLKKFAVAAGMALCTWLACQCGEGETLLFIITAGLAYLAGGVKE